MNGNVMNVRRRDGETHPATSKEHPMKTQGERTTMNGYTIEWTGKVVSQMGGTYDEYRILDGLRKGSKGLARTEEFKREFEERCRKYRE